MHLPVSEALSRLNIVIRHPDALQQDNVMAYDNAVSALGKICQFHRDSIDSAQVVYYDLPAEHFNSDAIHPLFPHFIKFLLVNDSNTGGSCLVELLANKG